MLKVLVANNAGFCFGVKKAVEQAVEHAADGNCYMLGDIIHNSNVTSKLVSLGLKKIESVEQLPKLETGEHGNVIIRSHGADQETYSKIKDCGYGIIDATCPFVVKIHDIVRKHYEEGYHIVIIGGAHHPEVIATAGWCDNTATIIDVDSDLSSLHSNDKLCFVCQTTYDGKKFKELSKKIHKIRSKTVEIFDTICYTTYERQKEAVRLAESCDIVLVVGDRSSSNTNKLYDLCAAKNVNTHFVQSIGELNNIIFPRSGVVGIVAGASTPTESIMEVKTYMGQEFGEASNEEFIEAINKGTVAIREGKAITGTVLSANADGIRVNVGCKNDGFIDKSEACEDGEYKPEDYPVGMEITAIVTKKRDDVSGCVLLSKRRADLLRKTDEAVDQIRNGEIFEVVVKKDIKGGLIGSLGTYRVFVPASQIRLKFVPDLKKFVGKTLRLRALDIDDINRKIVASQRVILQEEKDEKDKKAEIFWENVKPDVVVAGEVKRISSYGAFVSVDGIDCLAHIDHLSYGHIESPDEVLEIGKTYDFLVLKTDREKQRVSLGYRELQPHPFTKCMEKHPVGSTVTGKVISVLPYGAFVEIEPGVEGLVHVSEAAAAYVKDINEVLHAGDEVTVKVLAYDEQHRKTTLSIRACLEEEKPVAKTAKPVKKAVEESDVYSEKSDNNVFANLLKNVSDDAESNKDKQD
ncbi:MAG: bifunctional 4-hydroxy-3-methylbut-2-enyl diphosphate reductase/30S ribosomal protein S1 [Clostridiales bacterium]|nr:bifunctional 4-hydroxy-3-methylbut-2-enyl diphosphate reductase/30S ribosomal protein S1 [Clostridiales bacterium]